MANGMNGNSKTPMEQIAELKKVLGETRKELEKAQMERDALANSCADLIIKWNAQKYTGDYTQAVYQICAKELHEVANRVLIAASAKE